MRSASFESARHRFTLAALLAIALLQLFPLVANAQKLGTQPATGQVVQGTDLGAARNEVSAIQHHDADLFYIGKFFGRLFGRRR
jgi:hypothetical protein